MVQLAGGVTAVQLKAMALDEDGVAVSPVGAEGTAVQLTDVSRISIPLTTGWFAAPRLKAITISALPLAVAVSVSSKAALTPTVPYMSRLVSTVVPLIATLNSRLPLAVK